VKLIANWPALALLTGLGAGALINECRSHISFAEQKENVEKELEAKLPSILPEGWKIVGQPSCVTWCRTMYGSEFDLEVLTDEPLFAKIRISCDTEGDKHSCGYRRLVLPCEER